MVAEGLTVIAGKDDDGILALSAAIEVLDDASELIVDQSDHGVVESLDVLRVEFLGRA